MDYDELFEQAFLKPRPSGWRPEPGTRVLFRASPYKTKVHFAVVVMRRGRRRWQGRSTPAYLIYCPTTQRKLLRVSLESLRRTRQGISQEKLLTLTRDSLFNPP